ncbi:Lachesin [Toxocara canis]|uniref:Lachesin n=1 Tax=Toxocara canis TaxID=6265 RepID=A0A0B2VJ52_TOXCA|nr:Lachesin [Toxocara canis]
MENVTALKGQDVEFRCKVSNLGKHMIAFLRADIPPRLIAFDERVFRQRDKYEVRPRVNNDEWVLVVKNVQENDIGGYSCQLNTDPILSRAGYLHLRVPPYVARTTASAVEIREGHNVTLSCRAFGNPPPTVVWRRQDRQIIRFNGATGYGVPPYVARTTASAVEIREGHNVTLSCRAFGNPPPTVVWRRQDRQIIRFNGATGYGASVFNGSDLVLTKVSRKHMSEYVCVASNGIPPDESWSVKLHVTFEPIVIPQSKVVVAVTGGQATLVCNVEAWPRPTMTWEKNGEEIFDSTKYAISQQVSEKYRSMHILTIKNIGPDQFGTYRCTAINDNGVHFADIVVREGEPTYSNSVLLTEGSGFRDGDIDADNEPDDPLDSDGADGEVQKREETSLASTTIAPSRVSHFTTIFRRGELMQQQISSASDTEYMFNVAID